MVEVIKSIRKYSEGKVAYLDSNGKWGFLDEYGNIIIEPIFYDVSDFSDGMAYVLYVDNNYNEYRHFIDKDGNMINKRGFSASSRFYDGYGLLSKKLFGSSKINYYLTDSTGIIIPFKVENFNVYDAALKIHNNIIIGKYSDVYRIEKNGIKRVNYYLVNDDHKEIQNFELNPVDNRLYSIMYEWDDGNFYQYSIINENCMRIFSLTDEEIIRLNEKYFMSVYISGSYHETTIFYIDMNAYDESRINNNVYNDKEYVTDARIIDDKFIILALVDGKKKLYSIELGTYTDINGYDEIYYDDGDDYFVCEKSNGEYDYIDKKSNHVSYSEYYIKHRNGIGISKKEEISEESNSSYKYNKYYIYDNKFNLINTFPNDYLDLKLKDLKHVGNVLVGKSLFNERTYVINPHNYNIFYFDSYSYEYFDGYFIVNIDNKYNLIDVNGNYILRDYNRIINIGNNRLLIDENRILLYFKNKYHEFEFDYVDLPYVIYNDDPKIIDINIKYISKFIEYLDTNDEYILVPSSTEKVIKMYRNAPKEIIDNTNVPITSFAFNILINKKDLINKLRIDQEDIFEYVEDYIDDVVYTKYENLQLWSQNIKTKVKYFKIRDCYKEFLKYFDLSTYNFDMVDITNTDFTGCNIKFDPQKIHNKDLRGVILHDYNLEKDYMADKSFFEGCITDESTCIIKHTQDGEIRYYFDENKNVKVLQLMNG